jgi:hypothetical protein
LEQTWKETTPYARALHGPFTRMIFCQLPAGPAWSPGRIPARLTDPSAPDPRLHAPLVHLQFPNRETLPHLPHPCRLP